MRRGKSNFKAAPEDKTIKAIGRDTADEMECMREDELKKVIFEASAAMREAKAELDANPEYMKAKADVSLLSSGKREVDKRQKAKIAYSLDLLERFGSMDPIAKLDWEKTRSAKLKEIEARKKARDEQAKAEAPSEVRHIRPAPEAAES